MHAQLHAFVAVAAVAVAVANVRPRLPSPWLPHSHHVLQIPAYLCRDVFMYHNKTNSWRIKDDIHSGNGWRLLEHRV